MIDGMDIALDIVFACGLVGLAAILWMVMRDDD